MLRDIDGLMRGEWEETLSAAAVNAFTYDGKAYGTPHLVSQVGFWYNKDLFAQAGVNAGDIKIWERPAGRSTDIQGRRHHADRRRRRGQVAAPFLLDPIWPSVSAARRAFEAANSGVGDGFGGPVFVKAARSSSG